MVIYHLRKILMSVFISELNVTCSLQIKKSTFCVTDHMMGVSSLMLDYIVFVDSF